MDLNVCLLGPPRIERGGSPVSLDTRKALALLAYLALAERSHSRDALAELLWPGRDSEHARGALRRTLSTLRKAIGEEQIETTRERIGLTATGTLDIDVHRFRRLTLDGAGEKQLEAAVELFGGDLLEGFSLRDSPAFEDWHRLESDSLGRELDAALERLVEARASRGDFVGAIRYAQRRLELDALHEPAHRQLIRLLAWSGDRAAALTQYRTCVRVLSSELGVAPLPETTDLYQGISEGGLEPPAGAVKAPPARAGTRSELPLVGREVEWGALAEAYERVGPDGHAMVVEGEAGIGKTRLAEAFLVHAHEHGAVTLASRCYEEESGLAYAPVVEALRARVRRDAGWVETVPARALAEAARLLPELGELRGDLAEAPALEGPGAEGRFLEGLTETLLAAAGSGASPGIVFLDDLQWADAGTLSLLGYIVRRLSGRPLLLVLAWRLPREAGLRQVMAEAERASAADTTRLARLSAAEVGELVEATQLDTRGDELIRRLYEETEGVPFLLVEYLAALEVAPPAESAAWSLPAGARELIRARVEPLTELARQVLASAAVLGRSFELDTVRETGGRSEDETVTALEELVDHGLVQDVDVPPRQAPAYDFGHEKVRTLVYEETSLARRRLLHRRAADSLARRGRPRAEQSAMVARHRRLAGQDRAAALEYVRAAEHARSVYANADALEHFGAALALDHPEPAPLHAAIGELQTLMGDYAGALTSYEVAIARSGAERRADLEHQLGTVHHRRGEWELAEVHLGAALTAAAEEDDATRSRILADLSLTAHERGHAEEAGAHARLAGELAERQGDARALARALNILGLLARARGETDEAKRHLERSAALAEELNDPGARAAALNNLALTVRNEGDLSRAIELAQAARDLVVAVGDRHREAALQNNLADLLQDAGRPEEAMEHLKRAVVIFADIGEGEEPQPEIWKLVEW